MPRSSDHAAPSWRNQLPVLVFESNAMGSVAVIRSLGRVGYPVHACARFHNALGFLSRYASERVVCPMYETEEFLPWLRAYIRQYNIRAFVPSEGLLLTIRPVFSEFAHLIPFHEQEQVLYSGMSKFDLFAFLLSDQIDAEVKAHLPPTLLIRNWGEVPEKAELEKLGVPLYIKVDGSYSTTGEDGAVYKADSVADAYQQLQHLAPRFRNAVIQGYVGGQGVGAFFLRWNGQLLAQFMHRRLHEVPYTGGLSSLRESWWHAAICRDALQKMQAFGWSGVAMFEYRWDQATDRFSLMEMNGRFWGSLHLALYAGVDFPSLLLDAFHGHFSPPVASYPQGIRCRQTFPLEVQHVWSRLKDSQLSLSSRLWSILEFLQLSGDPRIYNDLFFPGDTKLYWESIRRFVRSLQEE
jgi:hypothetical protein